MFTHIHTHTHPKSHPTAQDPPVASAVCVLLLNVHPEECVTRVWRLRAVRFHNGNVCLSKREAGTRAPVRDYGLGRHAASRRVDLRWGMPNRLMRFGVLLHPKAPLMATALEGPGPEGLRTEVWGGATPTSEAAVRVSHAVTRYSQRKACEREITLPTTSSALWRGSRVPAVPADPGTLRGVGLKGAAHAS